MTYTEHFETRADSRPLDIGEVMILKEGQVTDTHNRLFYRREARVGDESDLDPERKKAFRTDGDRGEAMLIDHPEWKRTDIRKHYIRYPETGEVIEETIVDVDPENKAARWLYYDYDKGYLNPPASQMIDWAKDFPTAIALEPLQRIVGGGRKLPQGELDHRTKELFTYMLDAIGIRARAHVYAQRLVEIGTSLEHRLKIISVGSGAAVPNIEATLRLEQEQVNGVDWKFFDMDPRALEFACELISEAGFKFSTVDYGPERSRLSGEITPQFTGLRYKDAYDEENESVDVVDALGLWEYLGDKSAKDFLAHLYPKVRSGGSMIVSNMLEGRPQQEFNQRAVGWPKLKLRSEEDLLDIVQAAGIDTEYVTMTHTEDGIYVVMEIKKP